MVFGVGSRFSVVLFRSQGFAPQVFLTLPPFMFCAVACVGLSWFEVPRGGVVQRMNRCATKTPRLCQAYPKKAWDAPNTS